MKKFVYIICFIILAITSTIYSMTFPETKEDVEVILTVTLEGAFNTTGEYKIKEGMTVRQLVKEVGVKANANMDALDMSKIVLPETRLYLPIKRKHTISLNKSTISEFITLDGVGEKTAQKIIDYRKTNTFTCLEDIMNVKGIGETRYLKYRDYLSL